MSGDRTRGWSRQAEGVLRRAGWKPGRSVPTATWESVLCERGPFVVHDAARRFLAEFGGLVTYGWPPDTIATSTAVRFDPFSASGHGDRFASASREAGVPLYPVGMADEGDSLLGISEDGALHLVRDRVERLGTVGEQGLDRLLSTQRTRSALWTPGASDDDHPFWRRFEAAFPGAEAGASRPGETDRVLRAAGWYPGRSLPTDTWEEHPRADRSPPDPRRGTSVPGGVRRPGGAVPRPQGHHALHRVGDVDDQTLRLTDTAHLAVAVCRMRRWVEGKGA